MSRDVIELQQLYVPAYVNNNLEKLGHRISSEMNFSALRQAHPGCVAIDVVFYEQFKSSKLHWYSIHSTKLKVKTFSQVCWINRADLCQHSDNQMFYQQQLPHFCRQVGRLKVAGYTVDEASLDDQVLRVLLPTGLTRYVSGSAYSSGFVSGYTPKFAWVELNQNQVDQLLVCFSSRKAYVEQLLSDYHHLENSSINLDPVQWVDQQFSVLQQAPLPSDQIMIG
jgi:hypothetical protein